MLYALVYLYVSYGIPDLDRRTSEALSVKGLGLWDPARLIDYWKDQDCTLAWLDFFRSLGELAKGLHFFVPIRLWGTAVTWLWEFCERGHSALGSGEERVEIEKGIKCKIEDEKCGRCTSSGK